MSSRISFNTVLKRLLTLAVLGATFFLSAGIVIYFAYGGREVQVPDLTGRSQADAQRELAGVGLQMRVTANAPSEKVDADQISEQDPRPGIIVKTGQSVRVVVSSGLVPAASPAPQPKATPGSSAARADVTPNPKPTIRPDNKKTEDSKSEVGSGRGETEKKAPVKPAVEKSDTRKAEKKDSRPGN